MSRAQGGSYHSRYPAEFDRAPDSIYGNKMTTYFEDRSHHLKSFPVKLIKNGGLRSDVAKDRDRSR